MSEDLMTADAPTGNEVMADAYWQFSNAGLRTPPVPRDLLPKLESFAPWRYGTRDVDPSDRHELMVDADSTDCEDYIAFGHVGHGVANWSICCRLLLGPLAVFVRHSWGGAFADADVGSADVHRSFYQMEELIVKTEAAAAAGLIPIGKRLVVVADDIQGSCWRTPDGIWETTRTPFDAAIAFVS
jgi:hypothetical protein